MFSRILLSGGLFFASLVSAETIYLPTTASIYQDRNGSSLASGEIYYSEHFTAAHKEISFNTLIRVINPKNKKAVVVRINDRSSSQDADLLVTRSVARALDLQGITPVEIEILGISRSGENPRKDRIIEFVRIEKNNANPLKVLPEPNIAPPTSLSSVINQGFAQNENVRFLDLARKKVSPRGYGVQIGAFMNDDNAFKYGEWASKKGYTQIFIENSKFGGNGFSVYRVIIGEYKSEEEADLRISELSRAGFQSAVVYSFREE